METTLFNFGGERIRVMADPLGEPWFVAVDVCRTLDIQNTSDAVAALDPEDRNTIAINEGIPGNPNKSLVNESGLYQLIFASRKPEAKAFKRWVTKEVLPQIRKTGSYSVIPQDYIGALEALLESKKKEQALLLENEQMKPKAEFFDAVAGSNDTLEMLDVSKLLGIGRTTMMARLRKMHILRRNNTPFQEYQDAGYFKVVESKWTHPETGEAHVTLSTRVFQRGVEFIRKRLAKEAA